MREKSQFERRKRWDERKVTKQDGGIKSKYISNNDKCEYT